MADAKKQNNGKAKKPRRPSALKRDIQGEKRNLRNRSFKSKVGTAIRALKETLVKKDVENVEVKLSSVYSLMDKGVKKGIYTSNKANRVKARLTATTRQA